MKFVHFEKEMGDGRRKLGTGSCKRRTEQQLTDSGIKNRKYY